MKDHHYEYMLLNFKAAVLLNDAKYSTRKHKVFQDTICDAVNLIGLRKIPNLPSHFWSNTSCHSTPRCSSTPGFFWIKFSKLKIFNIILCQDEYGREFVGTEM
ncbi:unnamed protein product [Rhizophagus irregularis]|uniref:Uncharacterized protein n=1 Tax=Rhizophagus irregularis TaxID=588596 RepID=A0A916EE07_9GLOM|nr:unnamed protein product [Rhizophagus irregularis]